MTVNRGVTIMGRASPLVIDVSGLSDQNPLLKVTTAFSPRGWVELPPGVSWPGDSALRVEATVVREPAGFHVEGEVHGEAEAECTRCLAPFPWKLALPLIAEFRPRKGGSAPRDAPDEEGVYPVQDEEIDLLPAVNEAVLLAFPMQLLCREECAGLCPECGQNLNEGRCRCSVEMPSDPRWSGLAEAWRRKQAGERRAGERAETKSRG